MRPKRTALNVAKLATRIACLARLRRSLADWGARSRPVAFPRAEMASARRRTLVTMRGPDGEPYRCIAVGHPPCGGGTGKGAVRPAWKAGGDPGRRSA